MKGMKNLLQRQRRGEPSSPPPPHRRSPRQIWYGGLFLSSLIAMGSTFEAVKMQRRFSPAPTSGQRWAVGSSTATFSLAFALVAMQTAPWTARLLAGTKLELGSIVAAAAFACASVGTATNPATGMAVNASGGISFGNLYYSTWAGFGCGAALLASFLRTERGVDVSSQLESRGRRFRLWVILVVTSLIVMGSSASSYDARCGEDANFRPPKYCRRAAFGVAAGCMGCVFSLGAAATRLLWLKRENDDGGEGGGRANKVVFVAECMLSLMLLCFYCFAVAYLTSEEGPGAPLGNLYYSTWISFGLILFIAVSCFEELQAAKLVYLRNQQGSSDASERVASGINLSNHERLPPIILPENGNYEANRQDENGFRLKTPPVGNRSGSVGEVQV